MRDPHDRPVCAKRTVGLRAPVDGDAAARAAVCSAQLGFEDEGRLRQRAKVDTGPKDDVEMSRLSREFMR